MGVLLFLRNMAAFAVAVAALYFVYKKVAPHVTRTLGKIAEEHDVEKLSTAEILARKYEKESK